jgi:hypothetical protein
MCASTSSVLDTLGHEAAAAACASCDTWLSGQQHDRAAGREAALPPAAFWLLLQLPDGACESHPLSAWQQVG